MIVLFKELHLSDADPELFVLDPAKIKEQIKNQGSRSRPFLTSPAPDKYQLLLLLLLLLLFHLLLLLLVVLVLGLVLVLVLVLIFVLILVLILVLPLLLPTPLPTLTNQNTIKVNA